MLPLRTNCDVYYNYMFGQTERINHYITEFRRRRLLNNYYYYSVAILLIINIREPLQPFRTAATKTS